VRDARRLGAARHLRRFAAVGLFERNSLDVRMAVKQFTEYMGHGWGVYGDTWTNWNIQGLTLYVKIPGWC
jgi:hypothetical protein